MRRKEYWRNFDWNSALYQDKIALHWKTSRMTACVLSSFWVLQFSLFCFPVHWLDFRVLMCKCVALFKLIEFNFKMPCVLICHSCFLAAPARFIGTKIWKKKQLIFPLQSWDGSGVPNLRGGIVWSERSMGHHMFVAWLFLCVGSLCCQPNAIGSFFCVRKWLRQKTDKSSLEHLVHHWYRKKRKQWQLLACSFTQNIF